MMTFYNFLLKVEAETPPTPPTPGATNTPPTAGNDPLSSLGGGMGGAMATPPGNDPLGGPGAGATPGTGVPRKSINVTTWEDALRDALGKDADRPPEPRPGVHDKNYSKDKSKPTKSLFQ